MSNDVPVPFLKIMDYDATFLADPDAKIVPCGVETFTSPSQAHDIISAITREQYSDLTFRASCSCGETSGNFYLGSVCPTCRTEVNDEFATDLRYETWLEVPEFAPPVLHPEMYYLFKKWLGREQKRDLIDLILTDGSKLPDELHENVGTGFQNFYDRFDDIVEYLLNDYKPLRTAAAKKRTDQDEMRRVIAMYRDRMFVRYLPILNKSMHMITATGGLTLTDITVTHISNAVLLLNNLISSNMGSVNPKRILESNLREMYYAYLAYTRSIIDECVRKKRGHIRKHCLGSRLHFSFRAVITPLTTVHATDQIHIPWKLAVACLELEVINILVNRMHKSPEQADAIVHLASSSHVPIVAEVFQILITEAQAPIMGMDGEIKLRDLGGIPVLFGRNPKRRHRRC